MLPIVAFGAGVGLTSLAAIALNVLTASSLVGQNLLQASCAETNNVQLNHSVQLIYINNVSPPSSIGEFLASIQNRQVWVDAEHEEVAAAFQDCIQSADDKKKAIQEFEGEAKDLVNRAVQARHQQNLGLAQANHDQEVIHCKKLCCEALTLMQRKKELSQKEGDIKKTDMGGRSARLLEKKKLGK
jgi:hypothetical protein